MRIRDLDRSPVKRGRADEESGQVMMLILVFTLISIMVVLGTITVTSVQLARMQLLDVADGAALAAADALGDGSYGGGVSRGVRLSDVAVLNEASNYVASRPVPERIYSWGLSPGTAAAGEDTAVVAMRGYAKVPFLHTFLGDGIEINVRAQARAGLR